MTSFVPSSRRGRERGEVVLSGHGRRVVRLKLFGSSEEIVGASRASKRKRSGFEEEVLSVWVVESVVVRKS